MWAVTIANTKDVALARDSNNTRRDYIATKKSKDWRAIRPLDHLLLSWLIKSPMPVLHELGEFSTREEAFDAAMTELR